MRDSKDNVVIICSIGNIDAMGVHTGDSITVAPAQTLTDREYQDMRDAAIAIIREIGVETGGYNVQFAVNPADGELMVIEMNPRVSRSSALASKATAFPIAKIAAKLAVGYTLDELRNDITQKTYAAFEPTIDYCVVKIPRFTFEKFPEAEDSLTTAMKSVGETMATGIPLAKLATKVMMGATLRELGLTKEAAISHWAVKKAVFPFDRFEHVDTLLGPEMKSTGEVMGIDDNLGLAIAKAQIAAGASLPRSGNVFISVRDGDKDAITPVAQTLVNINFTILATSGTAAALQKAGVQCQYVNKISQGRPHILDKIQDGKISWIINTSLGKRTTEDSYTIRRAVIDLHIPYTTTVSGAAARVKGILELAAREPGVQPVQYFTRSGR